jgi:SAM-dependent methyltransferase
MKREGAGAGISAQDLLRLYASGTNVMAYLREFAGRQENDPFTILAAYDLQAGSYVRALASDSEAARMQLASCQKFAELFDRLAPKSVLEVGVGEATTLGNVLVRMRTAPRAFGFDIALSRVLVGREYVASLGMQATLFTAALEHIPLETGSIDIVYTSHSVEPNGGRERVILEELYRVARCYLVLREPSDEMGSEATRERMQRHGYARGLHRTAVSLGYDVIEHSRWELDPNPANEAALIVIRKDAKDESCAAPALASPINRRPLVAAGGSLYSPEDCLVFPVLAGIPCLLPESGIFCTQWLEHVPRE